MGSEMCIRDRLAKGRMRSKIPRLKDALAGRFNEHHALLCQAMLARIDQADATIDALGVRIGELLDHTLRRQCRCW